MRVQLVSELLHYSDLQIMKIKLDEILNELVLKWVSGSCEQVGIGVQRQNALDEQGSKIWRLFSICQL